MTGSRRLGQSVVLGLLSWALLACSGIAPPAAVVRAAPSPFGEGDRGETDANAAIAAAVPTTDIWLLPLREVLARDAGLPDPRNVTARNGYDNQPAFNAAGDTLYYASIRDGRQSDIFALDIASGVTRQVTSTPQSEYSPTPRPGDRLSLVQVALDGTQRLWLYATDGTPLRALRPDITGVGYHAWITDDLLALFVVEEPSRLLYAPASGQGSRTIARDVGRSLQRRADGTLGYVSKADGDNWTVRAVDVVGRQDRLLAATRPAREDLAWLPDGSALSGDGRTLYRLPPGAERWRPLVDLSAVVPGDISRIAVDPRGQWLAIVVSLDVQ